jgi:hypothetical protein
MFELRRERHSYTQWQWSDTPNQVEPREVWIDADVLVSDDGFKLIRFGKRSEIRGIWYRYLKGDVALDIVADCEHCGGTITGTYSVALDLNSSTQSPRPPTFERTKVEEITREVDAALRAWPQSCEDEHRPIGEIYFFVKGGSGIRYNLTYGQPVALRQTPPSTRWERGKLYDGLRLGQEMHIRKFFPNHDVLARDDGVRIVRIPTLRGLENDGPDSFQYSARDVSFTFQAERRLSSTVVTDTWEVRLDHPHHEGFSSVLRARLGPKRCAEIIRDIEEALYAWPPEWPAKPGTPVNRVVFLVVGLAN